MFRPMHRQLGILAVALLAAVGAGAAQPANDDLAKLKEEVARINVQQQQILASLDELKKMMKGPGQPALKPRPTMTVAGEPFKGDPAAKLAIIEYADFQCPFCRRFEHDIYPQLRDSYVSTGKLKFFHRDMPLAFHQGAMPAARAVHCATEQGKFWEMHDSLLGDAASLSASDIDERAGKLGLNVAELDSCISSDRFAAITHTLACQRMFGARNRQNAEALVAIGAGDDGFHARQLRRLRDIDFKNLGVRIRTAKNSPRQHSRRDKIGGVFGAAGHFLRTIDHRHVVADIMSRHDLVHSSFSAPLTVKHPQRAAQQRAAPLR